MRKTIEKREGEAGGKEKGKSERQVGVFLTLSLCFLRGVWGGDH